LISSALIFLNNSRSRCRRKPVPRACGIHQLAALVVADHERVEVLWRGSVSANHELLTLVHPHLLPGTGAQAGLILAVSPDLTEERIRAYIRQRQGENISGRTINMELGELSRAIGHPWSLLWPRTRKLEERKDIGQALSPNAQRALLDGLQDLHSPHLKTLIPVLLLTGMRAGEGISLTWGRSS
jgi:integrase